MSEYLLPDSPSKAKRKLLALEAYGMTKPMGLMSRRNGREQTCVCLHCLFVYSTVAQWWSGLSVQVVMVVSGPELTGYGTDGSLAQGLVRQIDPFSDQRTSGGTCSADSCINPLPLFPGILPWLPPQHVTGYK